ncbi:hypothetical protein U9M48_004357 [Paspalum notatum var. saurae]|uniref:Receptor kinase-like protein Xa21 n=1 Tax=Paspalum notatum var. saurae TaxID=547442 RepID=A0AAQ3PNJ7_PASNO
MKQQMPSAYTGTHWLPVPVVVAIILLATLSCPTVVSSAPTEPLQNTSGTDLQGLLCLKLHLSGNNGTTGAMAPWKNDSVQYCSWPGVICSKRHASRVVVLALEAADLNGQIPPCVGSLTFLRAIHLPSNQLNGQLPPEIGHLKHLTYLNLSYNSLTGKIPDALSSCSHLQFIDLTNNFLDGEIPSSLGECSDLWEIHLMNNKLYGIIPEGLGTLPNLTYLVLANNILSGGIPFSLGSNPFLFSVILTNNTLTGGIPFFLANSSSLEYLDLTNNNLDGEIPSALLNSPSIRVLALAGLDLSHNNLSGEIPLEIGSLINFGVLNISNNQLSGTIPSTLGNCMHLESLHMEGNLLHGTIPESFSALRGVTEMDLSRNDLSGEIPGFFESLSSMKLLNLSFNNLEGPKRKKVKQDSHPFCKELRKFSYADLVQATNGFSLANLVGSGKSGSVYKGRFQHEEHTFAVKVFKLDQVGIPKSFLAECEALKNTRHRNLLKVITACSTFDPSGQEFKALILEYMPNGSLESWLYPKPTMYGLIRQLNLGFRITIAMDIASALDYLHSHSVPPLVHCDLKPSNVLLDDVMGAHLADFGSLNNHMFIFPLFVNVLFYFPALRDVIDYTHFTEYGFRSKLSTEGDVYSYGIIILEMLTGKRPTDEMFTNGLSLHKFVQKAFPHKIGEILDPSIILSSEEGDVGNDAAANVESCIMHLVKLGLSCSVETPKDRPKIQDVYAEVITINEAFAALRG